MCFIEMVFFPLSRNAAEREKHSVAGSVFPYLFHRAGWSLDISPITSLATL